MEHTELQSIHANAPSTSVSDKYSFIPTTRAIEVFENAGWRVSSGEEIKVRKPERKGKQKHLIRFRHPLLKAYDNEILPEIVLVNSHDATAAFSIMMGFFRMVCSNGLIVSDGMFQQMKIRHSGYAPDKVRDAIEHVIETVPHIVGRVKDLQQIELRHDQRHSFAYDALALRYKIDRQRTDMVDMMEKYHAPELLHARRPSDAGTDLWTTYNQVQENLTKGAHFLRNQRINRRQHYVKARPITSVSETVRVNRGLWDLALKYANTL